MDSQNVTPIRPPSGPQGPAGKPRRARLKRPREGLLLRDSNDGEGFSTLDLVYGLQGVCVAIDASSRHDTDFVHRLSMAAKILSTMLADRVEI